MCALQTNYKDYYCTVYYFFCSQLGTFTAGDIDLDVNARVFFQIIDGNTAQAFTIEGKLCAKQIFLN